MKTLIFTDDGKPTDETDALVKKLKGAVCYRSENNAQIEQCDEVFTNNKAVQKLYPKAKPIKSAKGA